MKPPFDIISFDFLGLHLQEPIGLLINWTICLFSIYAYKQIDNQSLMFGRYWRLFYFFLAISTFFGGLGHLLFHYFDVYGKFPSWTFAVLSGVAATLAMLENLENHKMRLRLTQITLIKSFLLISLAVYSLNFVYVAIDAIVTYLLACGVLGFHYYKRKISGMKYIVIGVAVLFPSSIIYLQNINLHRYLNRDDLSHLLMLGCIFYFYKGVRKYVTSNQNEIA